MIQSAKELIKYTSSSHWYSLMYPTTWEFEEVENCTTFYKRHNGTGALQISAYETDVPQSATENLYEYLHDKKVEAEVSTDLMPDGQELATCSYEEDDLFTKVWFITKGNHLVFVTYNSNSFSRAQEEADVEVILQSLQTK